MILATNYKCPRCEKINSDTEKLNYNIQIFVLGNADITLLTFEKILFCLVK